MGWFKKQINRVSEAVRDASKDVQKEVGKTVGDILTAAVAPISVMTTGSMDAAKAVGSLSQRGVDELTGAASKARKEKKENEIKAINAAQAAAKTAADTDYYNQIMKARNKQVAAYMDSQTGLTQEGEALGDYGKTLGSFGDVALSGKKKRYY